MAIGAAKRRAETKVKSCILTVLGKVWSLVVCVCVCEGGRWVVGFVGGVVVLVFVDGEWIFVEMREGSHSFILVSMDVNTACILKSSRLVDSQSLFGVSFLGISIGWRFTHDCSRLTRTMYAEWRVSHPPRPRRSSRSGRFTGLAISSDDGYCSSEEQSDAASTNYCLPTGGSTVPIGEEFHSAKGKMLGGRVEPEISERPSPDVERKEFRCPGIPSHPR